MNKIIHAAQAGTMESSDILIQLMPAEPGSGIKITLESPVKKQFGSRIQTLLTRMLVDAQIPDAIIHALDRGALDYAIEARMETAISRAIAPLPNSQKNAKEAAHE